jgi:hypothetical protein
LGDVAWTGLTNWFPTPTNEVENRNKDKTIKDLKKTLPLRLAKRLPLTSEAKIEQLPTLF